MLKRDVLDKGIVGIVNKMGGDIDILRAARVSTGATVSKGEKKDKGLIDYLYRNNHISPFSFVQVHLYFKCPIFVARQIMRHTNWRLNEASARYKEFEWETYFPDEMRMQNQTGNKQGSDFAKKLDEAEIKLIKDAYDTSKRAYYSLLGEENGFAREQVRTVMPVGQYTEFYASVDMRYLLHFLELRMDEHAQEETRVYAKAIFDMLKEFDDLKHTMEIFERYFKLNQKFQEAKNICQKKNKNMNALMEYLDDFIEANKGE